MAHKHDSDPDNSENPKNKTVATVPGQLDESVIVKEDVESRDPLPTVEPDAIPPDVETQPDGSDLPQVKGVKNPGGSPKQSTLSNVNESEVTVDVVEPTDSSSTVVVSSDEAEEEKESSKIEINHQNSEGLEPEKAKITVEELLASEIALDTEAVGKERKEIELALKENEYWTEKQDELVKLLGSMVSGFSNILEKFETRDEALTSEIRNELTSRAEGIRLCERMIKRAQSRLSQVLEPMSNDEFKMPKPLSFDSILLKVKTKPVAEVKKVIEVNLKKRRINNNQVIGQLRRRSNSVEKTFLSFIERQLLPVIDALDEGKKISTATIQTLLERFPESKKKLESWFKTYDALRSEMEENLAKIGIHPFYANPGDVVDYDRYDPTDVEEDANFDNEQIKETLRRGYLLSSIDGEKEEQLIRPGQVVVVMNTKNDKNQ